MSNNLIDEQASQWVIRMDAGSLSADDEQTLERWLAADRRHLGAYARASAVYLHADRASALGPAFDSEQSPEPETQVAPIIRYRGRVGWAVAAMMIVGFATFSTTRSEMQPAQTQHYQSGLGEVRRLPLADGSILTLNTDSAVQITLSAQRRQVKLLSGEALFDVAKDANRPFVVSVDDAQVRAVGTSFSVRRMPDSSFVVLVREGKVQIEASPSESVPAAPPLTANMRASARPGQTIEIEQIATELLAQQLTWREGMIAFDGDTLAEAAEEFARYSRRPLWVDDEVAQLRIVGLYAANDPQGFADAVALSLGLQSSATTEGVRLSAAAR